jgi:CheY-like chemotaxis protein
VACHVLVVDDDPMLRLIIAEVLEDAGYVVEAAADGAEALEKVRDHPPAALLLDLMMPVMSGWRFMETCRAEALCPDVPVLIMSAGHRAAVAEYLGARGFLAKPFDIERLVAEVGRLVGGR